MTTTPSLRRMWTMYKKLLVEDGMSRRSLARAATYCRDNRIHLTPFG
jgi:hypothetical protein